MYATTIVDGSKKDLKFFKNIEISTDDIEERRTWEPTNLIIEHKEKKNNLFPIIGGWPSLHAATKAIILALAISSIGYAINLTFRAEKIQPVLKIDHQLQVSAVEVDGKLISHWTASPDSTELTLPGKLATGEVYKFVVKGKNGSCAKQDTLRENNPLILLDCIIIPEKVSPVLLIDNALNVKNVKVDGVQINNWKSNADTTEIRLPLMEVDSSYFFEVEGSNGNCLISTILTKENTGIQLSCRMVIPEPQAPSHTLTIYTPFKNPILRANKSRQNSLGESDCEDGSCVTHYKLQQGNYDLEVSNPDPKQPYICRIKSINLNREMQVRMDCSLLSEETYDVTIKVKNIDKNISIDQAWVEIYS